MTRRTRLFFLGSVTVLLVGLCAGLVAYYAGLPIGALGQSDSPDELVYVPPDAAVVAYANVRDVMRSELRKRARRAMPAKEHGQAEFERETGINVERDIDRVVGFLVPGREHEQYRGMLLASGRFDVARLEARARHHGGHVQEYKGTRLISRPEHNGEAHDVAVAFLAPGLVGVGDTATVKGAIDRLGGQNITANQELMDLIRDIDDSNAWAVGRFDALMSKANLPAGVASQLPAIRWFSASGHVNGGVNGMLRVEARDERAGQDLRDVAQGFLALARMQSGSKPEVQAVVNSLQLSGSGSTVALSFTVPAEVLDALAVLHGSNPSAPDHQRDDHRRDDDEPR